jgi:septum formation protein
MSNGDGSSSGPHIILASGSQSRRAMLTAAGLSFEVIPSGIDEHAIREALGDDAAEIEPDDVADILARAKAEDVSRLYPDALVIGGDQVLALGAEIYDKPADMATARSHLLAFRGRVHELHAAVVLAENGVTVWGHTDAAALTMRNFSTKYLDAYLAKAGDAVLQSVGAYQLEGLGVQLFEKIDGDYFTILGMPLLPLLGELRRRKVLPQ